MVHYLGPHSDEHLLYNDWNNRDSLLVTHEQFIADMQNNLNTIQQQHHNNTSSAIFYSAL